MGHRHHVFFGKTGRLRELESNWDAAIQTLVYRRFWLGLGSQDTGQHFQKSDQTVLAPHLHHHTAELLRKRNFPHSSFRGGICIRVGKQLDGPGRRQISPRQCPCVAAVEDYHDIRARQYSLVETIKRECDAVHDYQTRERSFAASRGVAIQAAVRTISRPTMPGVM